MNCPTGARPEIRVSVLICRKGRGISGTVWGKFGGAPPWKIGKANRATGSQLTTCAVRSPPWLWCAVRLLRVEARLRISRETSGHRHAALVAVGVRMVTGDGDRHVGVGCRHPRSGPALDGRYRQLILGGRR